MIMLLVWNWKLGLTAAATLPLFLFYINKTHGPIVARATAARQDLSSQNDILLDLLQGIKELRFFQQEAGGIQKFNRISRSYRDSMIGAVTFTDWTRLGVDFVAVLVTVIPFLAGGLFMVMGDDKITVGLLIKGVKKIDTKTIKSVA